MAKKFDLKATALGRVTESSADETMIGALTGKPSNDKVVVKLPLSLLDPYPLQEEAYPVQDGDYEAKAESMSKLGQLDPIHVVRAARGRYQILAGHRRVGGAKLLGWTEIDAIIDDVSPSIAEAIFHATNLESQELMPSQRMRGYIAIEQALAKEQHSSGTPIDTLRTTSAISERTGDDRRKIQRYKRLEKLSPELLALLDAGDITFVAAYDLSFLNPEEQQSVYAAMNQSDSGTISPKQASSLKNLSGAALLTPARVTRVLIPAADGAELPTVKATPSTIPGNVSKKARKTVKKIKLPWSNLYMFFPAEVTDAEVEQTIYDALDAYTRKKDCEEE